MEWLSLSREWKEDYENLKKHVKLIGEMELLKIKTRLIDEMSPSVMGECDLDVMGTPHLIWKTKNIVVFYKTKTEGWLLDSKSLTEK